MTWTLGVEKREGSNEASLELRHKPPLFEYFRNKVRHWDSTARQGMPQVAGGNAVFTWRNPREEFPALYLVPDPWLRRALSARNAPPAPPPVGSALPAPANRVVRGFTLDPSGTRVAALLGPADTELAGIWLLSAGTPPLQLPGPRSWHAAPVWAPDGNSLWVLSGKPPEQTIWRCELDEGGPSAPPEPMPFPWELGTPAAGARLRLGIRDGALLLTVRTPGAGTRCWLHREGIWNPSTNADPDHEQIPGHKVLARVGSQHGDVLAIEGPTGTKITLNRATLWWLEAAEQLTSLSISTHPDGSALWIQSASPELPSAVICMELPEAPDASTSRPRKDTGAFAHLRLRVPARDGVMVPVIVSARVGDFARHRPVSPRPLLLSCYGGFGVVHRSEPEPSVVAWIAAGGIHVAAQVRGGGELGPQWHEAGRGSNKLNAIHDVIDVARYLVAQGWTRVGELTAVGASHGGLVVCAAALLEPDAFGRVIAVAPLLDTVELHRHGLGSQWLHEFGADGETSGQQRAAYSPRHLLAALDSADHLPPLLCWVIGNDERVDNATAVEFVLGIRNRGGQAWLHRERGGGHAQRAAGSLLDFSATVLSFAAGRGNGIPPG